MSAGRPTWWTGMIAFVARCDRALGGSRVEVVGAWIDVGEDRLRATVPDGVGGRDEGQRRHDHLVAWPHARDVQRERKRCGAARRGNCLGGADTRGESPLECAHTRGPCETQPDAITSATAAPLRARIRCGRVIGISITRPRSEGAAPTPARSARHQSTSRRKPSSRSTSASKPSRSRASARVGEPPRNLVDRPLRADVRPHLGAHHLDQHLGELQAGSSRVPLATLKTSSLASAAAASTLERATSLDVDEVHRLRAVAEDQWRLAGFDALHPTHQHLGVDAVDVHARSVHVEVAQRHVVEPAASSGSCAAVPR